MSERFAGKTAIVTGGANGMGEATVRALYAEGASVVILDTNEQAAASLAASLDDEARIMIAGTDVADRDAVAAVIAAADDRFGGLHILVNCAGIRGPGMVAEVQPELWRRVHAVNLEGTLNTMQFFTHAVAKRGHSAAIVNISSLAGLMGVPNRAPYVSSKYAIIGITQEMAMEVGPLGIRVNAIAPGMVRTPMTAAIIDAMGGDEIVGRDYPLRRTARPEEIAAAILFLASDEASFITGVVLPVDGGYMAGKDPGLPLQPAAAR